jgi:hypothetical protein
MRNHNLVPSGSRALQMSVRILGYHEVINARLHEYSKFHLKARVQAQSLTVKPEQRRDRTPSQSNEGQQAVTPTVAQCVVHVESKQWKCGGEYRARDGDSGHSGGSIDGEGIDHVVGDG